MHIIGLQTISYIPCQVRDVCVLNYMRGNVSNNADTITGCEHSTTSTAVVQAPFETLGPHTHIDEFKQLTICVTKLAQTTLPANDIEKLLDTDRDARVAGV